MLTLSTPLSYFPKRCILFCGLGKVTNSENILETNNVQIAIRLLIQIVLKVLSLLH